MENHKATAPPAEQDPTYEKSSVNKCVSELSARLSESLLQSPIEDTNIGDDLAPPAADPSSFVTVIEVNGLKSVDVSTSPLKLPPK